MAVNVSVAIHPGEHIAEELEERSMSAADLARAMGVDRGRVSRLVNGRTAVTGETAILLSRVFETSPEFAGSTRSSTGRGASRRTPPCASRATSGPPSGSG